MAVTRQPTSLRNLQRQFGTQVRGRWQTLRRQFYSYVQLPVAGSSLMSFFGNTLATAGYNKQLTNIPKAGSFGTNHFLIKQISCDFYLGDLKLGSYASTDVTTFFADLLYGFAAAGVFRFKVGARSALEVPLPFQQMPPSNGTSMVDTAGIATGVVPPAHGELQRRSAAAYLLEPEILIEADQQFECTIEYPSGAVPVLATSVVNDTTNPLYIGVFLDGLIYRPVQ